MTPVPELVSTAHSPMTDGHLHAWGWEIPVYLFLGGLTAGIMVLSGLAHARGRRASRPAPSLELASSGPYAVGLATISLGMLALFLDLAHKPYVWRLYLAVEPASPMSWGAWILVLVYPVLVAGVLLDPPRALRARLPPLVGRIAADVRVRRRVGQVSIGVGLGLGIYTGILLSALGARPLWSSAALGPLFLVSGLSTSAALLHWWSPDRAEAARLARLDSALIGVELALLALFLVGLSASTSAHVAAAALLLGGPYTAVFWVGVVGLGLVLPLALQTLSSAGRVAHTPVAPILVLVGGLALRFVIVAAGQASHWPGS
jgi:protein NrfD